VRGVTEKKKPKISTAPIQNPEGNVAGSNTTNQLTRGICPWTKRNMSVGWGGGLRRLGQKINNTYREKIRLIKGGPTRFSGERRGRDGEPRRKRITKGRNKISA